MLHESKDRADQEAFAQLIDAVAQLSDAADAIQKALDALTKPTGHRGQPAAPLPIGQEVLAFYELAAAYAKDAIRQSVAMTLLYSIGLCVVGLAAWLSTQAAGEAAGGANFAIDEFLARGSVVIVLLLAAVALIWQADRHRRAGAEQLRLARQLRTLPTFIESLESPSLKDLMRSALAPRFFPPALDDDDVLREPVWPNPDQVMALLEAELADDESEESASESEDADVPDDVAVDEPRPARVEAGKRKRSSQSQGSPASPK